MNKKPKITIEEDKIKSDGKLTIDVYQTDEELVIQSAVAGVELEDLDVSIEKDLLLIKGKRNKPERKDKDYFCKECYWGSFSRKIILPVKVDKERIKAKLKKGILTIRIPKQNGEEKKKVIIEE